MLRYGNVSTTTALYWQTANTNVQIAATSKFAICGSFLRMCQVPADTRLEEPRCILQVYWLAADTKYEDNQSTRLGLGQLPIPLTISHCSNLNGENKWNT